MNLRNIVYLLLVVLITPSCQKNDLSKIPQIDLLYCGPSDGKDYVRVNVDTAVLQFSLSDGDADLGNKPGSGKYDIYIRDFRFDTGYQGYYFPEIDGEIKDPNKGLSGTCTFSFIPPTLLPRTDSFHIINGDTTHFEVYIMDVAGNKSNHIITGNVVMRM